MPPAAESSAKEDAAEGHRVDAENRSVDLAVQVDKLSLDMHAVKGNLAANTAITLEMANALDVMKASLGAIDFKELAELMRGIDAMKGGFKVLGWLERPAKWIAAITGGVMAVWAAYHNWGK